MQKTKTLRYYIGATLLVALIAVLSCVALQGRSRVSVQDSGATRGSGISYEQTVRDEQMRWGHGHTLSDPSPPPTKPAGVIDR